MFTRSNIGFENENGSYTFTYCHFDGYFEGVGCELLTDFNSFEKAEKLVLGGDMSTLTKPYENDNAPQTTDYLGNCFNQEFAYVFMGGQWHACMDGVNWRPLHECVLGSKNDHAKIIIEFLQKNGDKLDREARDQHRTAAMYEDSYDKDMLEIMKQAIESKNLVETLEKDAEAYETNPVINLIETIIGDFVYYNREGNEISEEEWETLRKNKSYREIKREVVGNFTVSTGYAGLAWVYETLVYNAEGVELYQDKYDNLADALGGHEVALYFTKTRNSTLSE